MERKIQETLRRSHLSFSQHSETETEASASEISDASYDHIGDSQFKQKFLKIISGNIQDNLSQQMLIEPKLKRNPEVDKSLCEELGNKNYTNNYKSMLKFRSKLPAYTMRSDILEIIKENQVVVISGETGEYNKYFLF